MIHSFFVPAFRTKQDVVPGRYSTTWFTPTKAGKYHLFCAEYCGTKHSGMIGWIYVMEPQDYQKLAERRRAIGHRWPRTAQKLFQDLACGNCHKADGSGRCPSLVGLFGKDVKLSDGRDGEGRRGVHPRIDSAAERQDRGRLPAGDAHLPGPGDRGRCFEFDRICEVAGGPKPGSRHAEGKR